MLDLRLNNGNFQCLLSMFDFLFNFPLGVISFYHRRCVLNDTTVRIAYSHVRGYEAQFVWRSSKATSKLYGAERYWVVVSSCAELHVSPPFASFCEPCSDDVPSYFISLVCFMHRLHRSLGGLWSLVNFTYIKLRSGACLRSHGCIVVLTCSQGFRPDWDQNSRTTSWQPCSHRVQTQHPATLPPPTQALDGHTHQIKGRPTRGLSTPLPTAQIMKAPVYLCTQASSLRPREMESGECVCTWWNRFL